MIVTPAVRHVSDLPQYTTWVVVDALDDLVGPDHGVLTLPGNLWWSGNPSFDLDDPAEVRTAYPAILREAVTEEDLTRHVNLGLLLHHWSGLLLPDRLRGLWEAAHPQLTTV